MNRSQHLRRILNEVEHGRYESDDAEALYNYLLPFARRRTTPWRSREDVERWVRSYARRLTRQQRMDLDIVSLDDDDYDIVTGRFWGIRMGRGEVYSDYQTDRDDMDPGDFEDIYAYLRAVVADFPYDERWIDVEDAEVWTWEQFHDMPSRIPPRIWDQYHCDNLSEEDINLLAHRLWDAFRDSWHSSSRSDDDDEGLNIVPSDDDSVVVIPSIVYLYLQSLVPNIPYAQRWFGVDDAERWVADQLDEMPPSRRRELESDRVTEHQARQFAQRLWRENQHRWR